jgi:hypothetical protein
MFNEALLKVSGPILRRNLRFKDLHKGESCYIFGDGVSLKDMNLECFSDKVAFASNCLCFHNDFKKLNVRYYVMPAPYWFFYFWKNPYTKKFFFNQISYLQRKFQKNNKDINFFINISNVPVLMNKNIFYCHHFGSDEISHDNLDLAGKFFLSGALNTMLGMAIYMGFNKAYLVGCDYTHSPQRVLHFYEKGKGTKNINDEYNKTFFDFAKENIKITTITNSKSKSKTLDYIGYNDYTGQNEIYTENIDIVNPLILKAISTIDGYEIL